MVKETLTQFINPKINKIIDKNKIFGKYYFPNSFNRLK